MQTGILAGAATLPIEYAWTSFILKKPPPSLSSFYHAHGPILYRVGARFWLFDIVNSNLPTDIPISVRGALGGAAGGFGEVCLQNLLEHTRPQKLALGSQTLKLFCCFGTYTFLSTTLSPEQLPPKPFAWCWGMGLVAGAVGSTIVAAGVEGIRGRALWAGAVPKGALTVGTVIAVQVSSCAAFLEFSGE